MILTVTQEIVANEAFFPVLDTNPQTIDEAARARIEAVLQTVGLGGGEERERHRNANNKMEEKKKKKNKILEADPRRLAAESCRH